uniref:histidine kinase n=1 Tax=Chromera velia CCMP2878 TaxID=1169474 RepID=A0A0G4FXD9_9ALVE|eukprot:Cvel_19254.t1-p1 / transcript=Cvel_19254.t1 / gene=Cvel_19254 / organism=Chromera_velia_CCMP2878 / gene_product=hypothetical protein / transcript_product=hypothetical protein / location=Cvel_scaffold1648:3987-8289(-) / protein_length=953 / sequence_SO=supercontig / SO=protein_coding / is_pseudo=false
MARSALTLALLFAFMVLSIASTWYTQITLNPQASVVEFLEVHFPNLANICYVLLCIAYGLLLSPWLRRRQDKSVDFYLNATLLLLVPVNMWPIGYGRGSVEIQVTAASLHCMDAISIPIIFSLYELKRPFYYFLLVLNGTVWTIVHMWMFKFDPGMGATAVPNLVLVYGVLATLTYGRRALLADNFEMTLRRMQAEEGYKRFLSYMMHEMRNPIGGSLLLLDEIQHSRRHSDFSRRHRTKDSTKGSGGEKKKSSSGNAKREGDKRSSFPFPSSSSINISGQGGTDIDRGGEEGDDKESLNDSRLQAVDVPPHPRDDPQGADASLVLLPTLPRRAVSEREQESDLVAQTQTLAADIETLVASQEFLEEKIRSSLLMMKSVCDDVLTLEKVQSSKFQYSLTTCNPILWVKELAEMEQALMLTHDIHLKVEVEVAHQLDATLASGSVAVAADWLHLRQVAVNFLSNARKFSNKNEKVILRLQIDRLVPNALPPECQIPTQQEKGGGSPVDNGTGEGGGGRWGWGWGNGRRLSKQRSFCNVASSSPTIPEQKDVCGWVRIEVSVSDSGAGMTEEEMQKLFLPYSQIRAGELQRGGGTGLGLCISKMFVEAHWGGRVGASSEGRGKGSTFYFSMYLPLVQLGGGNQMGRRGSGHVVDSKSGSSSSSLLLAFPFSISSQDPRNSMAEGSDPAGSPFGPPLTVSFGEALRRGKREGEREQEEKIVPPMTAPSSRRSLRNMSLTRKSRSSVLSTERAGEGEEIGKNPSKSDLHSDMQLTSSSRQSFNSGHHRGPGRSKIVRDSPEGKSKPLPEPEDMPAGMPSVMQKQVCAFADSFDCLVVDDIWICAFGVFRAVERLGYRPWLCLSGERCLEVLRLEGAVERVRLVLMDKDMPGIDGPETVRRLKDFFAEQGVKRPVILGVTGEVAGPGVAALKEAGCDRVLSKPCGVEDLKTVLKELCE